jgi:hypothetical protein
MGASVRRKDAVKLLSGGRSASGAVQIPVKLAQDGRNGVVDPGQRIVAAIPAGRQVSRPPVCSRRGRRPERRSGLETGATLATLTGPGCFPVLRSFSITLPL